MKWRFIQLIEWNSKRITFFILSVTQVNLKCERVLKNITSQTLWTSEHYAIALEKMEHPHSQTPPALKHLFIQGPIPTNIFIQQSLVLVGLSLMLVISPAVTTVEIKRWDFNFILLLHSQNIENCLCKIFVASLLGCLLLWLCLQAFSNDWGKCKQTKLCLSKMP